MTLPSLAGCEDAYSLAEAVAQLCPNPSPEKDGWRAKCPAHQGKTDTSLSITPTDDRILLKCFGGCESVEIVRALGLTMADLFVATPRPLREKRRIVKIYDYVDMHGHVLHQTVRYEPKFFLQRRPDAAHHGEYLWNLDGIETVLYHLPEILEAVALDKIIYVVEGEKDADTLQARGLNATCNPMGAKKWRKNYSETLRGAQVVLLPDFDVPGMAHAAFVAEALKDIAASTKIIADFHTNIPGSDITDWFASGGTLEEFEAITASAPCYISGQAGAPAVVAGDAPRPPPLPARAACKAPHLSTWLGAYVAHSTYWAPRAAPGFHIAVGLWVLSTIAARRIVLHMGSTDLFPTLFLALVSESTHWTKTTAAAIGVRLVRRAGCGHLLSPDRTTPQFLLKLMAGVVPQEYAKKDLDEQEEMRKAYGFSAQRGWFYEEWGGMLHQMRRIDSPQAELNKLLIVLEGGAPTFETGTIARGLERINNPYLALLGNATPHDLLPFMGEGDAWWHDGFWPRFVCVTPPAGVQPVRTPRPREAYTLPGDLVLPLSAWHARLGSPTVSIEEIKEESGKRTGEWKGSISNFPQHTMLLDTATYDAYETYNDALMDVTQAGDVPPDLSPWYSRAHEKALRVAMLLASIEGHDTITLPYWQEAQCLVEDWRTNLHELVGTLASDGPPTRQTRRRLKLERRADGATRFGF